MTRTLTASLVTLGSPDRLSGGSLYHRRVADRGPASGFSVRFVSVPERPFPLAALDVRRLLPALAADVIVVDSLAAAYLAPWRSRLPRPVVAVLHQAPGGMDAGPVGRAIQAVLDEAVYRRCDALVAASQFLADEVGSRFHAPLHVVPPGCDAHASAGRPSGSDPHPVVLCVGNWVPRKGTLELLDAFAAVPRELGVLHLAGRQDQDRRYGRRVLSRLAAPDLRDRVVVHGPVPPDQVGALFAAADLFVLPSTVEPFGTVYAEAMAAGLPVVGWEAGNLPHLIEHGREGLLVATGDVAGLSAAITTMLSDRSRLRDMRAAAAARAALLPTWDGTARRFFDVLRSVIDT